YVNNSSEYWNRAASLIATDPAGLRDLEPVPEARIYLIAGAEHYVGNLRDRGIFANCVNTLNHYRVMRALILAFDRWVREGVEPPQSTYPRIADGTLVTIAANALAFPRIPDFRLPEGNLRPPRLDFGSRFETDRIADEVPPTMGKPFETLVPKPDVDGLDQGGIALPDVLVPLGTRTGFNTRNDAAGFPWAHRTVGWLVRAVPAHRDGAAGVRRPAAVASSALCKSRRVRGQGTVGGRRRRRSRFFAARGRRCAGGRSGRSLRSHHGARPRPSQLRLFVQPLSRSVGIYHLVARHRIDEGALSRAGIPQVECRAGVLLRAP